VRCAFLLRAFFALILFSGGFALEPRGRAAPWANLFDVKIKRASFVDDALPQLPVLLIILTVQLPSLDESVS
jgi:hypothetical protein